MKIIIMKLQRLSDEIYKKGINKNHILKMKMNILKNSIINRVY